MRLDRFSPYFDHAAENGLVNLRAMASYRHLYPFPTESLLRIAYYFEFDYVPEKDPRGFADELIAHTDDWIRNPESGELRSVQTPQSGVGAGRYALRRRPPYHTAGRRGGCGVCVLRRAAHAAGKS